VVELLGIAQRFSHLTTEEQRRNINTALHAYSRERGDQRERGDYARVWAALLLSVPETLFTDEARAAGLLEPLAHGEPAATGPLRQFAALLHMQLGERLREQRRTLQVREQLEALKAIERSILERTQIERTQMRSK